MGISLYKINKAVNFKNFVIYIVMLVASDIVTNVTWQCSRCEERLLHKRKKAFHIRIKTNGSLKCASVRSAISLIANTPKLYQNAQRNSDRTQQLVT